jgi:hypothetical protein
MMAKVQAKKAASAKKSAAKTAKKGAKARGRVSAPAKKKAPSKKVVSSKKVTKKKGASARRRVGEPAKKKAPPKKKVTAKPKTKTPPPRPRASAPPRPASTRPVLKAPAAKVVAAPAAVKVVKAPVADEKKRARRPRTRVQSTGVATANWFSKENEKPRPSSFIPAPPRAEAPSLVAAPPASSDRLIRPEDLNELAVRTVPVRVDVEQNAGRVYLIASPSEVNLKPGEGIEWDFRYLGGADVTVEELLIEFDKPSPFSATNFKSRKPGAARPHRQMSGPASKNAAGKRAQYTVRALNPFKTELATTRLAVSVVSA